MAKVPKWFDRTEHRPEVVLSITAIRSNVGFSSLNSFGLIAANVDYGCWADRIYENYLARYDSSTASSDTHRTVWRRMNSVCIWYAVSYCAIFVASRYKGSMTFSIHNGVSMAI